MVKLFKRLVLLFVAVAFVVGLLAVLTRDRARPPASSPPEQRATTPPRAEPPLVGTAISAVKHYLKAPDAASFPPRSEWRKQQIKPGDWRGAGEVTSVNSFNARVREAVEVEVIEDGDNMRVVFVKIGDRVQLDARGAGGGR
jgi:hypothetical protein